MASDEGNPSSVRWPAVSYESLPWPRPIDRGLTSRNQARRHTGSYRAALPPFIANTALSVPGNLASQAEDAAAEIARFDSELGTEIAPFSAVLLRSESAASSQIENITASARAIAEAELGAGNRRNASEVVANVRAMEAAVALARRVDGESILRMHRALMQDTDPAMAGQWRQEQVWIGGGSLGPHDAMFVPPHHSRVAAAIDDLTSFLERDDLPLLAHAAIAHAQFETIHPFTDGNGRTGRALLHTMLRNKGLTRNVTVPVSAGLLTDTPAYFAALDTYRAGDPTAIIASLCDASFAAIGNGRRLVSDLRAIRAAWHDRLRARRDSAAWRIADLLLRHPVVNASLISKETGIPITNVHRYLGPLEDANVIVEFTDRRRNRAWRCPEVLTALDAFASRAGRRR